jgi:hypothetical protein
LLVNKYYSKRYWKRIGGKAYPLAGLNEAGLLLDGELVADPQPADPLPTTLVDITDDVCHRASSL